MPLRNHFHAPLNERRTWDELHGQWPAMIVMQLAQELPTNYIASPQIHLGGENEYSVRVYNVNRER